MAITKNIILSYLKEIPDPEIPVLSIVDLGIIRDIIIQEYSVEVKITSTYSGCPAMKMIEEEIVAKLKEKGIEKVKVNTVLSPAWTTDWMSDEAKEKLRKYGIAPPQKNIFCPRCSSQHAELISQFGSTACKALYRCKDCKEPFDYFKCI